MTTKLVKWASNDGQIIKSGLSDGRRAIFLPSVVGVVYNRLRYECHLLLWTAPDGIKRARMRSL